MPKIEYLEIESIRFDPATQPRAAIDETTVGEYRETLDASDPSAAPAFREVVVYFDGTTYWLADGYHRVLAHKAAGRDKINAHVFKGTKRDAILYSVGANSDHGLRRSNADKRKAASTLLSDLEWAEWSDHEIARRCKVSQQFVSKLRHEIAPPLTTVVSQTRRGADGRTTNTANIGRKPEPNGTAPAKPKPQTRIVEDKSPDFDDSDFNQTDPDDEPENVQAEDEPEPIRGQSIINGVLQDDDEITADQRRRGTMPPGAVPDITINDPSTFPPAPPPEREAGDQEPETVQEWLGTLPLYRRLANDPLKKFVAAAKLFYRLRPHREVFRVGAAESLKGLGHDNELAYYLKSYLKVGNPKYWPVCPPTKEGGCDGIGQLPGIDEVCPMCFGRGFRCREAR